MSVWLTRKRCAKCKELKSRLLFYKSRCHRDGLHSYCKSCERARSKVRKANGYKWFRSYVDGIKLASGCVDCGYKDNPARLEFDHLPGFVKRSSIAIMHRHSKEAIDAEIAKCEVVCKACHIKRTNERGDTQGGNLYRKELQAA